MLVLSVTQWIGVVSIVLFPALFVGLVVVNGLVDRAIASTDAASYDAFDRYMNVVAVILKTVEVVGLANVVCVWMFRTNGTGLNALALVLYAVAMIYELRRN